MMESAALLPQSTIQTPEINLILLLLQTPYQTQNPNGSSRLTYLVLVLDNEGKTVQPRIGVV